MSAKRYLMAVLTGIFMTASVMASTYTINNGAIDVGGVDSLLSATKLANSGDATELGWIQSVLGSSYTMSKFDDGSSNWTVTDQDESVFATNLGLNADDYFFIKIGNSKDTDLTHFLFKNVDSLSWAVLGLEASFGVGVTLENIGKVSHIGDVSAVPIPAAGWLFGSALIGFMSLIKRRRV